MRLPPGPRGIEVLGFVRRTLPFLEQTARRFGPISYFRLLNQHIYLVDEPEFIQDILVSRQHLFRRDAGATLLRELVGDGLLTRDEPAHAERRRVLQPAFHRARVASYAEMMEAETIRAASSWQPGSTIDIAAEMKRLTLAVVGATLFGSDFRESAGRIAAVLEHVMQRSRRIAPALALLEPLAGRYRRRFPHGRSLFFASERAELERILAPVIGSNRRAQGNHVLCHLLADLSDQDAANEIVTLVLAGHETTATALGWAWHLIAQHPEVESRLREDSGHAYAEKVFTETLRLYPSAPVFGRRPIEPIELGGYEIPAGASILVSPYVMQRNERWFPRAASFEPERSDSISIPKFAYFPFGGGAKMCIGDGFARMEGALVLHTLSRQWRFIPQQAELTSINASVTLRPGRPLSMRLERITAGISRS